MEPRHFLPALLAAALVAMSFVAAAQDDGKAEQQTNADSESEDPVRMSIVHKGPGRTRDDLAALFPDEARELTADGETFVGLFRAQTTAEQEGGAVIIADTGQSPAHGPAAGLRRALPESGWSTLSIGLPSDVVEPLPERVFGTRSESASDSGAEGNEAKPDASSADDDGAESNADDEPSMTIEVTQGQRSDEPAAGRESWRKAAVGRVGAAVTVLRDQGIQNIVLIGVGAGADMALRYAEANAATFPPGGLGLVWLDARFRDPYDQALDEVLGEDYAVPVLDLYDRERSGGRAPARQSAAKRGGFENYTQSALPMPRLSREAAERRLGSWVAGWLNDNMAGSETQ